MTNYFQDSLIVPTIAVNAEDPAVLVPIQAQTASVSVDPSRVYSRWSGALDNMFTVQDGRMVYSDRFLAGINDTQESLMEVARRDFIVTPANQAAVEAAARITAEQLIMNQIATNIAGIRVEIAYDRSNITTNPNFTGTQAAAELARYDRIVTNPIHRRIDGSAPAFNARSEELDAATSLDDLRSSGVLRPRQPHRSTGSVAPSNYEPAPADPAQLFELPNPVMVTAEAVRNSVLIAA